MIFLTRSELILPKRRVRNLPRYVSEIKAPTIEKMLEVPFQICTTFTTYTPLRLYFESRYTVKFDIKLMDANFSKDSFPLQIKGRALEQ